MSPQPPHWAAQIENWHTDGARWSGHIGDAYWSMVCPYGQPGDRLAFLEGYQIVGSISGSTIVYGYYLADHAEFNVVLKPNEFAKWKARKYPTRATPGRFMYNSLVRYKPPILSERAEQVQAITQEDIIAEGIPDLWQQASGVVHRNRWIRLWDSINAKRGYSWASNPWVWVVEFPRCDNDRTS
jgi:hypothetical protein